MLSSGRGSETRQGGSFIQMASSKRVIFEHASERKVLQTAQRYVGAPETFSSEEQNRHLSFRSALGFLRAKTAKRALFG